MYVPKEVVLSLAFNPAHIEDEWVAHSRPFIGANVCIFVVLCGNPIYLISIRLIQ